MKVAHCAAFGRPLEELAVFVSRYEPMNPLSSTGRIAKAAYTERVKQLRVMLKPFLRL
jgi:hypothetical protein